MTREQIYNLWAPIGSPWSIWAKPVLFAHLSADQVRAVEELHHEWSYPALEKTAIVVDLPGPASVAMGLSLAAGGYRPVPLFNAVPGQPYPAVDVLSIADAIVQASPRLAEFKIPWTAPPAFLLDHSRRVGRSAPGTFDNRSISLPTDFPSAAKLREHNIDGVLVIQPELSDPQADLCHTLRRWQDAGIPMRIFAPGPLGGLRRCHIERPSLYKAIWHNLVVAMGLRRNPLGGFGGLLPVPSAG